MKINFKSVLLLDAFGALSSSAINGLVLPRINYYIGLPVEILYLLGVIPLFFATYSFFCFFVAPQSRGFLAIVMIANLLYCALTASIVIMSFDEITKWAVAHFAVEILVILSIVAVELRVYRRLASSMY